MSDAESYDKCPTFILGQDVDLSLEFLDRLDGTRGGQDLTTANLFAFDTSEESTHVVASLSLEHVI
jgi:hypothetical protein